MSSDRRRHARQVATRPCKLLHRPSRLFTAAETQDVSEGGVLVKLHSGRPFTLGEDVEVFVSWTPTGVVPSDAMTSGKVVRAARGSDGCQYIAVRFSEVAALSAVA
jgi:c-di-GMP-binding flagellar brake protein YcgR